MSTHKFILARPINFRRVFYRLPDVRKTINSVFYLVFFIKLDVSLYRKFNQIKYSLT